MPTDLALPLEYSYLALPEAFYTLVAPTPVVKPALAVFNATLATELGLDFAGSTEDALANLFSGTRLPPNARPFAQAYAGHQFGGFTMLGDGRAHVLGEHITPHGERVDLQLKGSGQTPYSRRGDGRAVLGPMLREYLISEAMAALGIPTTRALAVVSTGESVYREQPEQGAVLTRVAASHLRVGTFEYAAAHRDRALLEALIDYTLARHFPPLVRADNKALALLDAVLHKQADLVVHWMRVGFVHGVMNTDNMALSGETIDYGPCAFMDQYDPATCFSSIDVNRRYAYANQPAIALWNLTRFAEALLPAIDEDEMRAVAMAEETLKTYSHLYRDKWLAMMRAKLGLFGEEAGDEPLIDRLLSWMKDNNADYTNTFRGLRLIVPSTQIAPPVNAGPASQDAPSPAFTCGANFDDDTFRAWHNDWQARRERQDEPLEASDQLMQQTNPAVIPRNHKVEQALAAATAGDIQPFDALLSALQSPYEEREALAPYQSPAPPGSCKYQTYCGT
ncbi:MAG: protein adenylyltransferase SelO [Phycisphaeraceae bacterium]